MKSLLFQQRTYSLLGTALLLVWVGCSPRSSSEATSDPSTEASSANENASEVPEKEDAFVFEAQGYEASAEQLLAARLPIEQTRQGWVRLFDGHTLFGWVIAGEANWRIEDGAIRVDQGRRCLLTTTTRWDDFELELEYQSDADTRSGVFLRTEIDPTDSAADCFEINIAPADDPYPTGSLAERKKGQEFTGDPTQWHTMNVLCKGESLIVKIDDQVVCQSEQASSPPAGYIGLQFQSGRVSFRNIRARPIGLEDLLDENLSQWKQYENMPGDFTINEEQQLVVDGGKQQLESKQTYDDFTLLADYKMDDPKSNSGIFFRSIPGDEMMGYECQVSNETVDQNPLQPADGGVGGIFRRQDARIVAGEPKRWNSILLIAEGSHFATWVNGLQVTDVQDERPADENPRRGLRLKAGTLIIQGHDKTTKAIYRKIAVKTMDAP